MRVYLPTMPSANVFAVVTKTRLDLRAVAVFVRTLSLRVTWIIVLTTARESAVEVVLALAASLEDRSFGKSCGVNAFW